MASEVASADTLAASLDRVQEAELRQEMTTATTPDEISTLVAIAIRGVPSPAAVDVRRKQFAGGKAPRERPRVFPLDSCAVYYGTRAGLHGHDVETKASEQSAFPFRL